MESLDHVKGPRAVVVNFPKRHGQKIDYFCYEVFGDEWVVFPYENKE